MRPTGRIDAAGRGLGTRRRPAVRSAWRPLAVALGLALAARPAVAQLDVDELEVRVTPRSPATRVATFTISSAADSVIQATLTLGDWDRDSTGANHFYPFGSQATGSCQGRLSVFPQIARLPPKGKATVRVTLEGPADAAACWSIVFVESQAPSRRQAGTELLYTMRTGVKVYAEPLEGRPDGAIEDMQLALVPPPPAEKGKPAPKAAAPTREVRIGFRSTGNVQAVARGKLEFRRPDNTVAAKVDLPDAWILPGARRILRLPLPPLARGPYVALALLDVGAPELIAGQLEFEVP